MGNGVITISSKHDPVFIAFMETVPEEVKAKLILCEWED